MLTAILNKPTTTPVELEEMKLYLRVDLTEDDELIKSLIGAVTRKIESLIDRKLIKQTWQIYWDKWPYSNRNKWWDGVREMHINQLVAEKRDLEMPFGPMLVESNGSNFKLETFDNDDVAYIMPSSDYVLDSAGPRGRLALRMGSVWPTTVLRPINGIRVTADFGYGTKEQIPDDIKLALKMWVSSCYEHRGDESEIKCPNLALSMLEPFRENKAFRGR